MATKKIKITFKQVHCLRDSAVWGEAEWHCHAAVDGTVVGDPNQKFMIKATVKANLDWSHEIDVSGKKPGEFVEATFKVMEHGYTTNSNMGEVKLKFSYPFDQELDYVFFGTPTGLMSKTDKYLVEVKLDITEETPGSEVGGGVTAGKKGAGDTVTTVAGTQLMPRVEVCPVVPPMKIDQLPPRPDLYGMTEAGKETDAAKPVALVGDLPLNALPNPSLIPVISPADEHFKKRAARFAITYIKPKNLNTASLVWVVKSGPVVLHGPTVGVTEVLAYGTAAATEPAEIEVRWKDAKGPVLSTVRAWVGPVKRIPTRATLIVGTTEGATPRATVADIKRHIRLANVLLYQSGLLMVPDDDKTTWDGAVEDATHKGVYLINTTDNSNTVGVNKDIPPHPMRLNFRPGLMHLCYVKSLHKEGLAGTATDRPGLKGDTVSVSGTPSDSWRPPTGIAPDDPAETVTMLTMAASNARNTQQDKDYLAERKKKDPSFPDDAYSKLYGCIMPDYTAPDDEDWPQTVAHEVGHVLGLRHRGNGATGKKPASDDDVNGAGGKGHPFLENVMCYGYKRSQDLDLVQTKVIRAHPSALTSVPKPPPPPPPPKPGGDKLKELQAILGVPETGLWDEATENAAKGKMVKYGTTGPVVGWVQRQLTAQGIDCGPADEISGSKTTAGIRKWQSDSNGVLDVDSVAGPRTMQSLAEA